jgi:hypothetical protein
MDEPESAELLALCEAILEDDEVSVDEVRHLGQWLDEHEHERRSWPGKIIAPPIQQVLLDGRVNKAELKKVATLLRRVQKESVLREAQKTQQDAVAAAARAVAAIDLSQAHLPSVPVTFPVTSHSEGGVIYDVDLTGPSCNCPDWARNRSALPRGDLTRCCKHTFDAFSRVRPDSGWPGWLEAFFEEGWPPHPETRWKVLDISGRQVLASTAPAQWANVFAPGAAGYQRFGFNIIERRWSYGAEPGGATQIAHAILVGPSDIEPLMLASSPTAVPTVRSRAGLFATVRRLLGT